MTSQYDTLTAGACAFAVRVHDGQYRKGTGFPYIVHPIGVAHLLRSYYPDREVLEAAGYLHDVIEDTSTEYEEVERRFGAEVAGLVFNVTRVPGWTLVDYRNLPDVLRLKAADMLDNMRDTQRGIEKGHDVWTLFAAGHRKSRTWLNDARTVWEGIPSDPIAHDLLDLARLLDRCDKRHRYHSSPHKGCILR